MTQKGLEVADVFRRFGPAFRDQHGASLSPARRRAMWAIERCRTAALGGHVERCSDCGHQRVFYNSCRNRSCPKCQALARAQWLADRQAELLEVPYFHVVFTVPEPIAVIAFQNQTAVYDILFRAASKTMSLRGDEFIRRFLIHVLPDGFRRIRYLTGTMVVIGCIERPRVCQPVPDT